MAASSEIAQLAIRLGLVWDKNAQKGMRDDLGKFIKHTKSRMGQLGDVIKNSLAPLVGITAAVFATRDALKFSESLARLDVTAKGGLGTMDELQAKILKVSDATGVSKDGVVAATSKYIELTGSVDEAKASMGLFAKVMVATGTAGGDVAGTAAAMSEQFGLSAGQMRVGFDILTEGGKEGSVELQDMAQHLSSLAAASQDFADSKGLDAAARMSAAFQIQAKSTGGNAAEALTQQRAFMTALQSNPVATALRKHGVEVFNEETEQLNSLQDIYAGLKAANLTDKDLAGLFKNVRAKRGAVELLKVDWEAVTEATLNSNAIAVDYANISNNNAVKLRKSWNKFANTMTKVFLIVVTTMSWIVDNSLPITIAILSIAGAVAWYNRKMLIAAVRTAWLGRSAMITWIQLLGPIILVALAIAAVILIVQDLWSWFRGGRSVFKDLHAWAVDSVVGWMEKYSEFFDWLIAKFKWIAKKAKELVPEWLISFESKSFEKQGSYKDAVKSRSDAADSRPVIEITAPAKRAASGGGTMSLVVNVESGANVNDETVTKIVDQTQAAMARTSRQLASEQ